MFATQPPSSPSTPFRQASHYSPVRPSPLGQRSTNIATPPWTMGSPTRHKGQSEDNHFAPASCPPFSNRNDPAPFHQTQSPPQFGNPMSTTSRFAPRTAHATAPMSPTSPSPATRPRFSERYASQIANPLKNTSSLARSKTRKMFLNRVKTERDTGRFEARGEQMMRMEHLADKKRWEDRMARDADAYVPGSELEEENMLFEDPDARALDELVSQEEAMEMAWREAVANGAGQGHQMAEPNGSFSDDEYDDIFTAISDPAQSNQDMDMS
ncbi:hypothetical protein N7492_008657 [Penicillium capsulatum]|uniref:Uncharacterized protein n=1 Tax=Penicillium capsulatum TaxID=69766 RepID=A0A9W9HVQ4_9EURO|nr:hypothetical protein N7492_008657 [Penicillium capsulatum]KAJ6106061.1 hypothetical protein N7512_009578 [Penicillium capsulatum]